MSDQKKYDDEFLATIEAARKMAIEDDADIIQSFKKNSREEAIKMAEKFNPPYTEEEKRKIYKMMNPIIFNK